ncbi:tetratricopeptide repeat protein, partial [candidate division WOR-3 bacterium]|nr:tetratricopeptide repeat protein [candidate division WOR-3 bacterium]
NKGFVHCDLKPEHILFDPNQRQVKLIDFGFAGTPEEDIQAAGTLGYIAPEVLKGTAINQRSDLYSLGVIMYEILSGCRFAGSITALPDIPDDIGKLLNRSVSTEPALRPTIPELYQSLSKYTQSGDVELSAYQVRLPSTGYIEVDDIIEQIRKKNGEALVILGDIGLGKTRLLQELKFKCLLDGNEVIYHQATRGSGLLEMLRKRLKTSTKEISTAEDKYQIFEEITRSFAKAANRNRIVLLIDDIGTLSNYELALFRYIGYGIAASNVLLIGTAKPSDTITALGFEHVMLNPLSKDEIALLIEKTFADVVTVEKDAPVILAEWLQIQTGGNPFFCVEVLKTLYDREILFYKDNRWQIIASKLQGVALPQSMIGLVAARIDNLAPDDLRVLKILALAEQPLALAVISDAVDGSPDVAVENVKSIGLAREDTINGQRMLSVMNKLTSDHVTAVIPDDEARSIRNKLVKATISKASDDKFYFNMLARLNDQIGDAKHAYAYYQRAAAEAEAIYDYDSALRNYERVADHAKTLEPHKYPEILLKVGDINARLGRNGAATECYNAVLKNSRDELAAKAYFGLGKISAIGGQYEVAIDHYSKALDSRVLSEQDRIKILNVLGYALANLSRFDESEKIITDALREARKTGDIDHEAMALYTLGSIEWYRGAFEHGIEKTKQLLKFCQKHNLLVQYALSSSLIASYCQQLRDTENAAKYFDLAIDGFRRTKRIDALCATMNNKALLLTQQGHLSMARDLFHHSLELARRIDGTKYAAIALLNLAIIYGDLGRFDESIALYEAVLAITPNDSWAIYGLIMTYFKKGDRKRAAKLLDRPAKVNVDILYHVAAAMACAIDGTVADAERLSNKAVTQNKRENPNINLKIEAYLRCAAIFHDIGNADKSLDCAKEVISLTDVSNRESVIARAIIKLHDITSESRSVAAIDPEMNRLKEMGCIYDYAYLKRLWVETVVVRGLTPGNIRR